MNENELLRTLEQATSQRPTPQAREGESEGALPLREAWEQLSRELTASDRLHADDAAGFLQRMTSAVRTVAEASPDSSPEARHSIATPAAKVAAVRAAEPPASWKGWLTLVACVAICGSAIVWFAWGSSSVGPEKLANQPGGAKTSAIAEAAKHSAASAPSDSISSERREESGLPFAATPEWTDPVDSAIGEAHEQLVALHGRTNWDRAVLAFEQYRQSVEQDMNDWDL